MEPTVRPAEPTSEDPFDALQARLAPRLDEAATRLSEANERVMRFVRENPGSCLVGAAALGFLAGRWASRR